MEKYNTRYIFCFRLDLAEVFAKTQIHQRFDTTVALKLSFTIETKFSGDSAEQTRRRSMQVPSPNSTRINIDYRISIAYIYIQ